jgi:hypothetical protein
VLEISVVSPISLGLLDNNSNVIVLFAETSSDEDSTSRPSFASPKKRRTNEPDFGGSSSINTSRNTVIVSPSKSNAGSDRPSMFTLNANSSQSSSQDSDSSDEDDVRPSIHQNFIKPKPAAQPIIDQKAKNMMVKKF